MHHLHKSVNMIIYKRRHINILIHNLLKLKKGKIKLLKIITKGERGHSTEETRMKAGL